MFNHVCTLEGADLVLVRAVLADVIAADHHDRAELQPIVEVMDEVLAAGTPQAGA